MAIKLSEIVNDKRTLTVDYFGQEFDIVYRPGLVTPAKEDEYLNNEDTNAADICQFLADVLVSWELTDDDGNPLPTDFETIYPLADALIFPVLRAIFGDGKEEGNSRRFGGGSSRKGRRTSTPKRKTSMAS